MNFDELLFMMIFSLLYTLPLSLLSPQYLQIPSGDLLFFHSPAET